MNNNKIKTQLDNELASLKMSQEMKENILTAKRSRKPFASQLLKYAAAFVLVSILGTVTVGAVGYFRKLYVNDQKLPELDAMHIVEMNPLDGSQTEYGSWKLTFSDYDELDGLLGIHLLDTKFRVSHEYMIGEIETDNKDYAQIHVENYIIGDTSNYRKADGEPYYCFEYNGVPYLYDSGETYYKTVSLDAFLILSEEQYDIGYNKDFLGMYEFVEQYTSAQGYKVNLVESTAAADATDLPEGFHSKKVAIFVADGIHYELSGNVSWETIKELVNSME